jgi:hypothetical protein
MKGIDRVFTEYTVARMLKGNMVGYEETLR